MGGRLSNLNLPESSEDPEHGVSGSVGEASQNKESDVYIVQMVLNAVPTEQGGPRIKLVQDGLIGSKTISAIRAFQELQFGQDAVDGRIDPKGRTIRSLMTYANRELLAEIKGIKRSSSNLGGRLRIPRPPRPGSKLEIETNEQEPPR